MFFKLKIDGLLICLIFLHVFDLIFFQNFLDDMDIFQNHCVVYERSKTIPQLRVVPLDTPQDQYIVQVLYKEFLNSLFFVQSKCNMLKWCWANLKAFLHFWTKLELSHQNQRTNFVMTNFCQWCVWRFAHFYQNLSSCDKPFVLIKCWWW